MWESRALKCSDVHFSSDVTSRMTSYVKGHRAWGHEIFRERVVFIKIRVPKVSSRLVEQNANHCDPGSLLPLHVPWITLIALSDVSLFFASVRASRLEASGFPS